MRHPEIYLNGVLALKPGKNVIAVHCENTGGEQSNDFGLVNPALNFEVKRSGKLNRAATSALEAWVQLETVLNYAAAWIPPRPRNL